MQVVSEWLRAGSLAALFLASLLLTSTAAALITLAVRTGLRRSGYGTGRPFQVNSAAVTTTSAIFALMIAFSTANIRIDGTQARVAVQREANALQNVRSIAQSFPPALRERVLSDVLSYAREVVRTDWPAMGRDVPFTDDVYDKSEQLLDDLIQAIAGGSAESPVPNAAAALAQVIEARSARLQRIALATEGVSPAQWLALLLIAAAAMVAAAMLHNHDRAAQYTAMSIYSIAVSAAVFVILAHDRPFTGRVSVGAEQFEQIYAHPRAAELH